MKRGYCYIIAFLISGCSGYSLFSQEKYAVYFGDKDGVCFNPLEYFDPRAIERRVQHNLPLDEYTDRPVREDYVMEVAELADSVKCVSRWMNAAVVFAGKQVIPELERLPFVTGVELLGATAVMAGEEEMEDDSDRFRIIPNETEKVLINKQMEIFDARRYLEKGIDGKGVRVAIFDAGFPTVDVNPAFEHIRRQGRIIKTWDFVKGKEHVYGYSSHGTMVMANIGGKIGDFQLGMATGAEFLLARTEMGMREPFSEEENWLAAAEWADKNGAHIINSSLGYTYHRYFNTEMNGKRSFVARAANIAASKGMLVVNAAGNDGDNEWKYVGTPADADSVLSVGGVSVYTGYHISFSSFGPTADGRMKPNVCAPAHVVASGKKGFTVTYGTSFASPLTAGFAACAWQCRPKLTNMELFEEIEKSGHLFPYYDYAHGFGIPQAGFFADVSGGEKQPAFDLEENSRTLKVVVRDFPGEDHQVMPDLNSPEDFSVHSGNHLYYRIAGRDGRLKQYYLIRVEEREPLTLYKEDFIPGDQVDIYYKGYTTNIKF